MAETYTLEEAYAHLQDVATNAGRCQHCGRRHSDEEAQQVSGLRGELAKERDRAATAEAKLAKATDERNALKVRNSDLRDALRELKP